MSATATYRQEERRHGERRSDAMKQGRRRSRGHYASVLLEVVSSAVGALALTSVFTAKLGSGWVPNVAGVLLMTLASVIAVSTHSGKR